jgi:hypothetical protein
MAKGVGRLIIVHGVNQEDLQYISINSVEISTGKYCGIRICDLNIQRPTVERDLFQIFHMVFFCPEIILLYHTFAAYNAKRTFYSKPMSLSVI